MRATLIASKYKAKASSLVFIVKIKGGNSSQRYKKRTKWTSCGSEGRQMPLYFLAGHSNLTSLVVIVRLPGNQQ